MKLLTKTILAACILTSTLYSKNIVGLNINDKDLEVHGSFILNNFLNMEGNSAYVLNTNYIHGENNDYFGLGLGVYQGYDEVEGLLFGFGLSNVYTGDFIAIPLFAHAIYVLPFFDYFPKTSLSAKVLYAPKVLTFSEGTSYLEFRSEIDFDIINNMSIYGGYRNIQAEHEMPRYLNDFDSYDSFYGGLKYNF